jgi:hypothetical protein
MSSRAHAFFFCGLGLMLLWCSFGRRAIGLFVCDFLSCVQVVPTRGRTQSESSTPTSVLPAKKKHYHKSGHVPHRFGPFLRTSPPGRRK